jgi:hypothetical protein
MALGAIAAIGIPLGFDLLKKDLIPYLMALADKLLGGKTTEHPTLGSSVKFPLVQAAVTAFDAAVASLSSTAPASSATIAGAVQEVFNEMNKAGLLVGYETVVPPITAVPGMTLDYWITVANWLKTMPVGVKS